MYTLSSWQATGISQDNVQVCKTWGWRGGKRKPYHKKPKHELGSPAASAKIARCPPPPCSEGCTCKTKTVDLVYNASHYKVDRTETLVKTRIVLSDSTLYPHRSESH